MIEVKVIIPNFRDKEHKELGLLQPGYKYSITKERAEYLAKKGCIEIMNKPKENKKEVGD